MNRADAKGVGRDPDFIIIGAMKCATSTLHEQLARQTGLFMSTPKEPNFFSDDDQWRRGVEWYRGLFAAAQPGDLCGESSTHYTKLPTHPKAVQRLHATLTGELKFIYVMRHPIERLVSQYIHEWTQRAIDCPIDEALDQHPKLIAYSRYAMQVRPYIEQWGRERIMPLFFEHLTAEPQQTLERVCEFIGVRVQPRWQHDMSEQNVSSERLRASAWRDALVNLPGMKALRRRLVPQSWRDRVKSLWRMERRPELSAASRQRLEDVFDTDLATLGEWLGIDDLRCATFTSIARQGHPRWRLTAQVSAA